MTTTYMRLFASASACLLTLSSCGGGDELSADGADLAAALATTWGEEGDFPDSVDTDCIAKGFIRGIGDAEGAAEYGITKANIGDMEFENNPLSEDDAMIAAQNMFECNGLKAAFLDGMGPDVTDEQTKCMVDEVDEKPLISLIASEFMGDQGSSLESEFEDTFEADLFAAVATCGIEP